MKRGKRSQASIIVIVLLIFLVLVGIILVWNIVMPLLNDSAKKADTSSLNLRGNGAYSFYNDNKTILIRVDRESGAGNISGVQFVLMDRSGKTYTITNNTVPRELESKIYNFSSSQFGLNNLSSIYKVTIYFLFPSKDNTNSTTKVKVSEKEGAAKDITSGGNSAGTSNPTCQPKSCLEMNIICGTDVIENRCNNKIQCPCSIGSSCNSGTCTSCIRETVSTTCQGRTCGNNINNCGDIVSCGGDSCTSGMYCNLGVCTTTPCIPETVITTCGTRVCGKRVNNCGSEVICGTCLSAKEECKSDGSCGTIPDCFNINDNPVKICTCNDLQRMNEDSLSLSKNYVLNNNIDCSETITWNINNNCNSYINNKSGCLAALSCYWVSSGPSLINPPGKGDCVNLHGFNPIGTLNNSFNGAIDGKGFNIIGLNGRSLFGFVNGNLTNIHLKNTNIIGTGALVGKNNGNIINCSAEGSVNSTLGASYLVTGDFEGITVCDGDLLSLCTSTCKEAGGLVGVNKGNILNSYFIGNVTGGIYVGGLVGIQATNTTSLINALITNSYAIANVKSHTTAGGLVGFGQGGSILKSYSSGEVSAVTGAKAFVGLVISKSYINDSFSTSSVLGNTFSGGTCIVRIFNSYYWDDSNGIVKKCDYNGTANDCSSVVGNNINYFYTRTNPPTDKWDFEKSWVENSGNYPSLR